MSRPLAAFFDEVLDFLWSASPTMATSLGVHDHDHRLVDWDPAALEARLQALAAYRRDLARRIASDGPSTAAEALDARLLGDLLESERRILEEVRAPFRDPGAYLEEILYGVYYLVQREFAPLPERASRVAARLREAVRLLRLGEANLSDPRVIPRAWVEAALRQAEGSLGFFRDLDRDLAPRAGAAEKDLRAALAGAIQAIDRFMGHLRGRLLTEARGDFAIGRDLFDFLLRTQHGLELDAGALRAFGAEQVALTQERLVAAAGAFDPGTSWQELVAAWKADHPTREEFAADYRREVDRARDFVLRKRLVTFPPGERLHVVETPSFQRSICPFAAYLAPGPFEAEQDGYFWVTPPEDGQPAPVQAKHLQDHLRPGIPGTTVHEAYPGHHLQLSLANRIDSRVRRSVGTPVLVEGWAFYCEQLMAEEGYYEDPRSRVLQLKDALWRSCRVLIDVGLHTEGMTIDQAVAMLHDVARLEVTTAHGEVLRYTRTPTQPMSYAAGKQEILRLREDYRRLRGAAFRLREFHDRLLSFGSIPIALIRERLLAGPPS